MSNKENTPPPITRSQKQSNLTNLTLLTTTTTTFSTSKDVSQPQTRSPQSQSPDTKDNHNDKHIQNQPTPSTMPQELTHLIHNLQTSFTSHHPRILEIYATIKGLHTLSSKLSDLETTNTNLGRRLLNCRCEEELQRVREQMREVVMKKMGIEGEMRRLRELWGEEMRWVEDEGVMHEMKSWEGWMK